MSLKACFLGFSDKLKGCIIFSMSVSLTFLDKLIFVVITFSGLFFATSSIFTPPSELEMKAIFELDLSTKQDK